MWGIIATWRMALEGVEKASLLLQQNGFAGDSVEQAVNEVENFPYYKSVGYGGLPNEEGIVELDAAYMDGSFFDVGAVCAIQNYPNPISIAKKLSELPVNNVLVGKGAEQFAANNGFQTKEMLSERAAIHYHNRLQELQQQSLKAYDGHDTVGVVSLDTEGRMVVGTSTSGLFMKKTGRVGDSSLIGSGFYVDSEIGGATATGLGEDIMKGVVSYEIVKQMEQGLTPQQACEKVVREVTAKLAKRRKQVGDISVVAMNCKGEWGASSNMDNFSFVVATATTPLTVYRVKRNDNQTIKHEVATQEWIDDYVKERMKPLVKK